MRAQEFQNTKLPPLCNNAFSETFSVSHVVIKRSEDLLFVVGVA
jgi:hypothetical protein